MMIDHGLFEEYRPAADNPILTGIPAARFCRNTNGDDWYAYQQALSPSLLKLLLGPDNVIAAASRDAGSLFPAGFRLVEIEADAGTDPDTLRRSTLVDGQIVAPPAPVLTRIAKADIWRRLSEPEAVTLDGALQAAPLRLRRIFEAAQYLDTTDTDYPALRVGIVGALGEDRADEVLAPTY